MCVLFSKHGKNKTWKHTKFIEDNQHLIEVMSKVVDELGLVDDVAQATTPEQKQAILQKKAMLIAAYALDLSKGINDQRSYSQVSSLICLLICVLQLVDLRASAC